MNCLLRRPVDHAIHADTAFRRDLVVGKNKSSSRAAPVHKRRIRRRLGRIGGECRGRQGVVGGQAGFPATGQRRIRKGHFGAISRLADPKRHTDQRIKRQAEIAAHICHLVAKHIQRDRYTHGATTCPVDRRARFRDRRKGRVIGGVDGEDCPGAQRRPIHRHFHIAIHFIDRQRAAKAEIR